MLNAYLVESDGGYLTLYAVLLELLAELCRVARPPRYPAAVEVCMEYMREHLSEKLALREPGERSGYSPLHLRRLFSASVGCTPRRYLHEMRIRSAKLLLGSRELSLEEVAETCGFSSLSHFKTVFKTGVGESPEAYRRRMLSITG